MRCEHLVFVVCAVTVALECLERLNVCVEVG